MFNVEFLIHDTIGYKEGLEIQKKWFNLCLINGIETLIVLQHKPVFTVGRAGQKKRYPDRIADIKVYKCNRGGDITLHNPGQIVFYPIMRISRYAKGPKEFVKRIEDWIISLLGSYSIDGSRREGFPGVWVRESKIASVGFRIEKGISYHGVSLNVCNDLKPFDFIDPCGIKGCRMTSIEQEIKKDVDLEAVAKKAVELFFDNFKIDERR